MRVLRRWAAALVCTVFLMAAAMPQIALAEDGSYAAGEGSSAGERMMLSVFGIGIVCAGGLTALITAGGKRNRQ